jgi:hypothetical protein
MLGRQEPFRRREGSGIVVSDPRKDRRWYLITESRISQIDARAASQLRYELEFQDVRLAGTDRYVRFHQSRPIAVVEPNGDLIGTLDKDGNFEPTEYGLEPVTDEEGQRTGWTVRALQDVEPGRTVAWHFDDQMRPTGTEVRLPGQGLAGKVLRTVETGEGSAGRRLVVVDPSAADRPTGWQVAERYDRRGDVRGVAVLDETGDRRWYLTLDHHRLEFQLKFQDVRLAGTDRYVRFDADDVPWHVVEANGDRIGMVDKDGKFKPTEYRLGTVTNEREQPAGLIVRALRDVGPGRTVAWHFDDQMRPTGTEVRSEASDPGKAGGEGRSGGQGS